MAKSFQLAIGWKLDGRGMLEGKGGTFRIYIIWISIYNMQEFILYASR